MALSRISKLSFALLVKRDCAPKTITFAPCDEYYYFNIIVNNYQNFSNHHKINKSKMFTMLAISPSKSFSFITYQLTFNKISFKLLAK